MTFLDLGMFILSALGSHFSCGLNKILPTNLHITNRQEGRRVGWAGGRACGRAGRWCVRG